MTCARCGRGGDTVQLRRLWPSDESWIGPVARLCDDCNDVVQGPDHIDVTTENLPPRVIGDEWIEQYENVRYVLAEQADGMMIETDTVYDPDRAAWQAGGVMLSDEYLDEGALRSDETSDDANDPHYSCAVCGQPIEDEDPHSTPDGEDCHADCCPTCHAE